MIEAASGVGDQADCLGTALGRAGSCLDGVWPNTSRYLSGLASLRERLAQERLQVAVLGQFKRGKSTFLNALLGDPVLPTGVVPLTSIATFIRFAAVPSMRVSFLDGRVTEEPDAAHGETLREQLARFVTEEGNPQNRLRVARVDVGYPAAILSHGIVLIDTPGIASTLRHQTDAAIEVLRECDAGFFVLSVDPPVTEAELVYLDRVRPRIAVRTPLTECPPHRSVRAAFPHTAPTSGDGRRSERRAKDGGCAGSEESRRPSDRCAAT